MFTVCIVYTTVCSRLLIVCSHSHTCTRKILVGHVVTVLEWVSASNRTALFCLFLNTFLPTMGCFLYMLLGIFANIILQFRWCVLYTRATYTQVFTVSIYLRIGSTLHKNCMSKNLSSLLVNCTGTMHLVFPYICRHFLVLRRQHTKLRKHQRVMMFQ